MISLDNDTELQEMRKIMNDRVLRDVSKEKAQSVVRQSQMAQIMEKTGSLAINGIGQRTGLVDSRVFFRWWQQYPGCWTDESFIKEFLRDNPACRAPGWHGPTGKPMISLGTKTK